MFEAANYAQPLRAIDQALELLNDESFDMEPDGEDFLVRGKATLPGNSPEQPSEEDKVRHIWGVLPRQRTLESGMNVPRPVTVTQLELRYTPKDVDRLESEGRAKRMDPRRIPDAGSLSQLFRTIGAYIGQKRQNILRCLMVPITRNCFDPSARCWSPSACNLLFSRSRAMTFRCAARSRERIQSPMR